MQLILQHIESALVPRFAQGVKCRVHDKIRLIVRSRRKQRLRRLTVLKLAERFRRRPAYFGMGVTQRLE
jgi:hypothetical protein